MGDIAEGLLDGTFDEQTGEYIGEPVGYPRTMEPGHYNSVDQIIKENRIRKKDSGWSLVQEIVRTKNHGDVFVLAYDKNRKHGKKYLVLTKKDVSVWIKYKHFVFD